MMRMFAYIARLAGHKGWARTHVASYEPNQKKEKKTDEGELRKFEMRLMMSDRQDSYIAMYMYIELYYQQRIKLITSYLLL